VWKKGRLAALNMAGGFPPEDQWATAPSKKKGKGGTIIKIHSKRGLAKQGQKEFRWEKYEGGETGAFRSTKKRKKKRTIQRCAKPKGEKGAVWTMEKHRVLR